MAKIMIAMSGGVDSSLVTALLHEQGHAVTGVTMHLWEGDDEGIYESQCCSQEMVAGARRVCAQLGVPYYVFNYQREFRRHVIEYFLNEYAHGYTPNPCLACNRDLKFRFLLERAQALGFDYLATGHYAQIQKPDGQAYELWRGVDHAKDQSYVLYMLQQHELARLQFPLGGMSKAEVRTLARERLLATADRPESQDICFIPDNDYRRFLREEAPESMLPGPIINHDGQVIGQHKGLPYYTVGQRKGLGITSPQPLFVTELDTERNALIVGPAEAATRHIFTIEQAKFVNGVWPEAPFTCQVQIRAHATPVEATITPCGEQRLQVTFNKPQRAITPGQAGVLYDGNRLLGGGRIARAQPTENSGL
jgi:tRNA-specific 2-thiouridylase